MHDPIWMRAFLAVHIAAGSSAFVLAPLALLTAKGGKAHRRWGKIYFWSMAVVAVTALVMAIYRPILFLALVAIFSFYSAFAGYRVLGQKAAYKGEKTASTLDWFAAAFTFVASALLASLGALKPSLVQNLGIPAMVFGGIGMWIAGSTVWAFTHRPKKRCSGGTRILVECWAAISLHGQPSAWLPLVPCCTERGGSGLCQLRSAFQPS